MNVEPIPDLDTLYCRVHKANFNFKKGKPSREVFKWPRQSADLEKLTTELDSVARHRDPREIVGLAFITASSCRKQHQQVLHEPEATNPAHSVIVGDKPAPVLTALRDAIHGFWRNPSFSS